MLTAHGEQEGAILERYQRFADDSSSPAVRYLVRLIVEDEERHHRVLDIELADIKELKRLRRRLDAYQDTTLWALLVDLMLLDTEKHVHILRFVASHAD